MSKGRLLLHLGAHKTGTSVIQRYMRDTPDVMAQNKVGFTLRGETDEYLGWAQPKRLEEQRDAMVERIRSSFAEGNDYFVLSHENALGRPFKQDKRGLYPNSEAAAENVAKMFESFEDVTVLFYVRNQSSFLESYYLQSMHEGGTHTFSEWLRRVDMNAVSWAPVVESIRKGFAGRKVIIRDFQEEISRGQEKFLERAYATIIDDIDPKSFNGFKYKFKRNISIGDKGLEIALRVNELLTDRDEKKKMRTFLQNHFNNRKYDRPKLLTDAEKERLDELYLAENTALTKD